MLIFFRLTLFIVFLLTNPEINACADADVVTMDAEFSTNVTTPASSCILPSEALAIEIPNPAEQYQNLKQILYENLTAYSHFCRKPDRYKILRKGGTPFNLSQKENRYLGIINSTLQQLESNFSIRWISRSVYDVELILFAHFALIRSHEVWPHVETMKRKHHQMVWDKLIELELFKYYYCRVEVADSLHDYYYPKIVFESRNPSVISRLRDAKGSFPSPAGKTPMEAHHTNQLPWGPVILLTSLHSKFHRLLHVGGTSEVKDERSEFAKQVRRSRGSVGAAIVEKLSPYSKAKVEAANQERLATNRHKRKYRTEKRKALQELQQNGLVRRLEFTPEPLRKHQRTEEKGFPYPFMTENDPWLS